MKGHGTTRSRAGERVIYRRIGAQNENVYAVTDEATGEKLGFVRQQLSTTRWFACRAFGPEAELVNSYDNMTRRDAAAKLLKVTP